MPPLLAVAPGAPTTTCDEGQTCGTATDDPCECDGRLIGPGAVCVYGAEDEDEPADPAPGVACLDWHCSSSMVCVGGAWRATTCTAEAGVDRVCRPGWCDWP